jgi:hypothetical protein
MVDSINRSDASFALYKQCNFGKISRNPIEQYYVHNVVILSIYCFSNYTLSQQNGYVCEAISVRRGSFL